nr:MAG TPA: TFIIB-TERMINAL DOMAIN, TFIIB, TRANSCRIPTION INITIATION [Caudoviricetes sp.]DAJ55848.1 MAG TPA: TFIIB-TERMINAL DOMAIN, TFIIB, TRANSCRIPTION INITIATION [Caudoviricetes sp.]
MLLKMVMNNLSNEKTLFWSDRPAETMDRYNYNYSAEIRNMYDHGVKGYMNDRITVYERPTENKGCNDYDNTAHCIEIANELDAFANSNMIRCPECGEIVSLPYEEGEGVELDCGCKVGIDDLDDLDEVNLWDYFEDCPLDIEYTINSDLDYVGARIMIAFGGPNIYINTNNKRVELYWGFSRAEAALSDHAVEAIDAYFEDEYNIRRGCL